MQISPLIIVDYFISYELILVDESMSLQLFFRQNKKRRSLSRSSDWIRNSSRMWITSCSICFCLVCEAESSLQVCLSDVCTKSTAVTHFKILLLSFVVWTTGLVYVSNFSHFHYLCLTVFVWWTDKSSLILNLKIQNCSAWFAATCGSDCDLWLKHTHTNWFSSSFLR